MGGFDTQQPNNTFVSTANMFALAKMTARPAALGRRCLGTKVATGLVGLPVSEDGVADLAAVSESILNEIQVSSREEGSACGDFYVGFFRSVLFLSKGRGRLLGQRVHQLRKLFCLHYCISAFC